MSSIKLIGEGDPYSLGATPSQNGVNFSLFSAHAEKVEVCFFDRDNREVQRVALPFCTNHLWHGLIGGVSAGDLYGYRVYGQWAPEKGFKFNHHKLLIDPYAEKIDRLPELHPSLFAFQKAALEEAKTPEERIKASLKIDSSDSANYIPKAIIPTLKWTEDKPPLGTPWEKTVIYEAHLKGLSMNNPSIQENLRGKFYGLKHDSTLTYLKNLQVSTLELLPILAFFSEEHLLQKGLINYWGYNPFHFFALHPTYYDYDGQAELQAAIDALHLRGIEVILDLVYNHTAESDHFGPHLSFKGIDNLSYYMLDPANPNLYLNYSGCGNNLNLANPYVAEMVVASLLRLAKMGVDGFRFDLASALGRDANGFQPDHPLLERIQQEPKLRRLKIIAEPWDFGGVYQGQFPSGFQEWNGQFKPRLFSIFFHQKQSLAKLAESLAGENQFFPYLARFDKRPVNYLTSHDGFNLRDRLSYQEKRNQANLENNQDGENPDFNYNFGTEGESDNPWVKKARLQTIKALNLILFFAQGVPLFYMGEEIGKTRHGNSNPYSLDNESNWLDWYSQDFYAKSLLPFFQKMIGLRLKEAALFRLAHPEGSFREIEWFALNGNEMDLDLWQKEQLFSLTVLYSIGQKKSLLSFNLGENEQSFSPPHNLPQGKLVLELCSLEEVDSFRSLPTGSNLLLPPSSAFWWTFQLS